DVTLNLDVPLELSASTTGAYNGILKGIHTNGNYGYLGGEFNGVWGRNYNGHHGFLGGNTVGAYGIHSKGHFGGLGFISIGAAGQNTNGNYGYLGTNSYGVFGKNNNGNYGYLGSENYGALGQHQNGHYGFLGGATQAVYGRCVGKTGNEVGVYGRVDGSDSYGIFGTSEGTSGGRGVQGQAKAANGIGVYGSAPTTGWAGYFSGNVKITNNITKGGGAFLIDHPLDPLNKNLLHSFVESPDMMNIYNGNVVTNSNGDAVVQLPEWFEALNKEFRYQLTVIGSFAQAIVSEEINSNQFSIKTDKPNVKVSWQVTGIRQDAYANANRIPVEQMKKPEDSGKYIHPRI
ncbi:MAG: hypothetical protein P8Z35_26250, partial [Ignavibacteriaceae bacterium]